MLPTPSIARHRRARIATSSRRNVLENLTRRSRITNLGVILILGFCLVSFLFNLRHWALSPPSYPNGRYGRLYPLSADRPASRKALDHLIMVPCHSIWKGPNSWSEEKDWLLEPYQRGPSRVRAFYEHIRLGYVQAATRRGGPLIMMCSAQLTKNDPHSLLVFSG